MSQPITPESRSKRFIRALLSGYFLLGLNIFYGLFSVALALHYLSKAEFGLWALVAQLVGYIVLIDMGMTNAMARTLIDHKDDRVGDLYGSTVLTGGIVNFVQALLIAGIGISGSFFVGRLLEIEPEFQRQFTLLVIGESIVVSVRFLTRPLSLVLHAHQRIDVKNFNDALQVMITIVVLWISLHLGAGVFSLLWSTAIAVGIGTVLLFVSCIRHGVLPKKGHWGRPTWPLFRELFSFGKDVFLFTLGNQFLNASQVILVTRVLGLEAAAIWAVCARSYNLILQVTTRFRDFSEPALSEMLVRKEHTLFFSRFRSLTIISTSLAAIAGVMLALCNQSFIEIWTKGKVAWPPQNDLLLGILVIVLLMTRNLSGLSLLTKEFGLLRYIYFFEGVFFVGVSLVVLPLGGITAMIGASLVGSCLFSFPACLWRVSRFFELTPLRILLDWSKGPMRIVAILVPIALLNAWLFGNLPALWRFPLYALCTGIPGGILFIMLGLDGETKQLILNRIPTRTPAPLRFLLR